MSSSFHTLCKIHHKTQMHAPIGMEFGTLKGLIKADLSNTFGRNLMNSHRVLTDNSHKKWSKVCHAYRVNPLKENCYVAGVMHVVGVVIIGMPFCGFERIEIMAIEI